MGPDFLQSTTPEKPPPSRTQLQRPTYKQSPLADLHEHGGAQESGAMDSWRFDARDLKLDAARAEKFKCLPPFAKRREGWATHKFGATANQLSQSRAVGLSPPDEINCLNEGCERVGYPPRETRYPRALGQQRESISTYSYSAYGSDSLVPERGNSLMFLKPDRD